MTSAPPAAAVAQDDGLRIDAPSAGRMARIPLIDAMRGAGIVAMVIYHLAWDLSYFGFIVVNVPADRGWTIFARLIAGSFLALVGVSLVLAHRSGIRPRPFLRRLAIISAAAVAVTLLTWYLFLTSFVFFGILHAIAVSSVLALPFLRVPLILVVATSAFAFAAPSLLASPVFNSPWLWWLGLMTFAPTSNDYVPIFPWFGVVLAGMAATRLWLRLPKLHGRLRWGAAPSRIAPLVWTGRHSLVIYLLHQPVLFGSLFLVHQALGSSDTVTSARFVEFWTVSCTDGVADERSAGLPANASAMQRTLRESGCGSSPIA